MPLDVPDVEGDGEPLQIEFAAVTNVAVVGDRLDDGCGHKDLSGASGGGDTGGFVDSLAQVVVAKVDGFGGMDTNAHLRSEAMLTTVIGEGALNRNGALDGVKGIGERYEEPISFVVDLPTVGCVKTLTQGTVMPVQHVSPRVIAQDLDEPGRVDNVGEHQGAGNPARPGRLEHRAHPRCLSNRAEAFERAQRRLELARGVGLVATNS